MDPGAKRLFKGPNSPLDPWGLEALGLESSLVAFP